MKLIQRLMGRRQFLAAAGVGSASALALGKLGGMWDPAFRTQVAMAAETAGAAGTKGADNRYPNLLSPIKIGSYLLKNRIFYPVSQPHMLNGPENFPNEIMRSYYANVAKTAAVVTVRLETGTTPRSQRMNDSAHMIIFDLDDYGVQNYISQMIEGVHSMGALAVTDMDIGDVSAGGGQSMTMAQARARAQQGHRHRVLPQADRHKVRVVCRDGQQERGRRPGRYAGWTAGTQPEARAACLWECRAAWAAKSPLPNRSLSMTS